MGTGRRRSEELVIDLKTSIQYCLVLRRRTALQVWCGAFVFGLLFAGCNANSSPPASTPDSLTIAVSEATLDTAESGIRQPAQTLSQEGIALLGADGRAVPRLAREWKWENEGRLLRIVLREGVKLHDGSPLTAAMVAEALGATISRPQNQISYPSFANVTAVRPTGELELVLELSRPSAYLPEDLALPLRFGTENIGTGAFRIVSMEPKEIQLERFDDYYLGRAQVPRVVIRSLPTLRAAWTSLLRGEVDMVTSVQPDAIEFVSNDSVQMVSFPRPFQYTMGFNSQRPILRLPQVRRALNLAIDREALIARTLQMQGTPSTGPIWPQHWAYDRSVSPYAFDPAQAASLLDSVGLRMGANGVPGERFSFRCIIPANFALVERIALELQRQLYNIGVHIEFDVVSIQEWDTRVRESRFEAMLIDMISGPGLSRTQLFWRSARQTKGFNVFGYENPEAERLFTLLSESTNEAAIRSATSRLQRVLLDDPPALFLVWTEGTRAVRRQFKVVEEAGRDPLITVWRWLPGPGKPPQAAD